jgi:hypothetical protein
MKQTPSAFIQYRQPEFGRTGQIQVACPSKVKSAKPPLALLKMPAGIIVLLFLCWYSTYHQRETEEDRMTQARVDWFHDRGPWLYPELGDHYTVDRFKCTALPTQLFCRGWLRSKDQLPSSGQPGDFFRIVGNDHIWVWPLPPLSGWIDP